MSAEEILRVVVRDNNGVVVTIVETLNRRDYRNRFYSNLQDVINLHLKEGHRLFITTLKDGEK